MEHREQVWMGCTHFEADDIKVSDPLVFDRLVTRALNAANEDVRVLRLSEMIQWINRNKMPSKFTFMDESASLLIDSVMSGNAVLAAKALLVVANCFSLNGSREFASLLLELGIVRAINDCASMQNNGPVLVSVLRAITRIAGSARTGKYHLCRDFSLANIGLVIRSVFGMAHCQGDCKSLLNQLVSEDMNADDAMVMCNFLWQLRDVIQGRTIVAISRIARWIPNFQQLPYIHDIISVSSELLGSTDTAEVQAALVTLSYAGVAINEHVRDLVFSSDIEVSITALWWLGKHVKEHPETLPLVADSAVLEYAMSLLNGNYSFHATVEAAYFFCRLITAANAESMRAMLPVVKGIGWLLTCDLDWRVTAKILQTLYKLATSLAPQDRIDVFDEELLENLEVVVSDKMGALACEILEVLA